MFSQICPHPNPGALGVCDVSWRKGLCRCNEGNRLLNGEICPDVETPCTRTGERLLEPRKQTSVLRVRGTEFGKESR